MANGLLGTYIATFSTTDIAAAALGSFAHALPAAPDIVIIQKVGAVTFATEASMAPCYSADATNVSFHPQGLPTGVFEATAIVAHSVIS